MKTLYILMDIITYELNFKYHIRIFDLCYKIINIVSVTNEFTYFLLLHLLVYNYIFRRRKIS